jgi:5'-3' exonuclease
MGIKNLNRFIRDNCNNDAVKRIQLKELSGKKIAVDTSIYLYKYESENCLIENMYSLLALFREYNIIPIFVFEGKSPDEKKTLLQKRHKSKQEAEKEYKNLKNILDSNAFMDDSEKQELLSSMDLLKKQFIYINKEKNAKVKQLIRAFGMTYYDAPGESDELCASLVIKKKVWAIMSEDMDMFVYGCVRVLRYFSLINHSVVIYNTNKILEQLNLTQEEFRQICVLSGTDYNAILNDDNSHNLINTLKLFKKYKKSIKIQEEYKDYNFYQWLIENSNYIENYNMLMNVYDMFDLKSDKHHSIDIFDNIKIMNGLLDMESMKPLLIEEGFIF